MVEYDERSKKLREMEGQRAFDDGDDQKVDQLTLRRANDTLSFRVASSLTMSDSRYSSRRGLPFIN